MKNNFIVCDVETGGLDYKKHSITQIALSVVEPKNFTVIEQFQTFIKPYEGLEITKKSLEVSRVSMEEINEGMDYVKVLAKLIEIIRRSTPPNTRDSKPIFVGHNFTFDIDFIEALFSYKSKDVWDFVDPMMYCTMRLMRMIERKQKTDLGYDLTACCSRFGIKLKAAHGAMHDVNATRLLLKAIIESWDTDNSGKSSNKEEEQQKSRKFFEIG